MKRISIMLLSLLMIFSLVGCGSPSLDKAAQQIENDTNNESENNASEYEQQVEDSSSVNESSFSGEAPRTDTPIFPDADLVYEKEYKIAVEELYATDAAVMDVIAFYEEYSQFESISETRSYTDGEGVYFETPLMGLLIKGDSLQEEIDNSGPLMYIMIVPSDSELLSILGSKVVDELPDNKTIISLRILTEY